MVFLKFALLLINYSFTVFIGGKIQKSYYKLSSFFSVSESPSNFHHNHEGARHCRKPLGRSVRQSFNKQEPSNFYCCKVGLIWLQYSFCMKCKAGDKAQATMHSSVMKTYLTLTLTVSFYWFRCHYPLITYLNEMHKSC
jgi:hypothetical protein